MPEWSGRYAQRMRALVFSEYGRQCHLCDDPRPADSVDHLIPRSKGGTDSLDNLRPAHLLCNQRRGTGRVVLDLPDPEDGTGFFQPADVAGQTSVPSSPPRGPETNGASQEVAR